VTQRQLELSRAEGSTTDGESEVSEAERFEAAPK